MQACQGQPLDGNQQKEGSITREKDAHLEVLAVAQGFPGRTCACRSQSAGPTFRQHQTLGTARHTRCKSVNLRISGVTALGAWAFCLSTKQNNFLCPARFGFFHPNLDHCHKLRPFERRWTASSVLHWIARRLATREPPAILSSSSHSGIRPRSPTTHWPMIAGSRTLRPRDLRVLRPTPKEHLPTLEDQFDITKDRVCLSCLPAAPLPRAVVSSC